MRAASHVPLTVPGLKLWVRTESLAALADGAAVASWPDESGNGKHLAQAIAAQKPVHDLDADGLPAVLFDGADDMLVTAANVLNTDRHTIFLVARPLATQTNDAVGTGGTGNGDLLWMLAGDRARGHIWRGAESNTTDGVALIHDGSFAIFEQETTATNLILRLNGNVDVTHALTGPAAGVSKPVYLGSRLNSWFFNGYVRALLVYEGKPKGESPAGWLR